MHTAAAAATTDMDIRPDAAQLVADLFELFPGAKQPTDLAIDEWSLLASEYPADVWREASRRHFRTNKWGTPNAAEMGALCAQVSMERRAARRANPASSLDLQDQWRRESEEGRRVVEAWMGSKSDAELEALRDRVIAETPFLRDVMTLPEKGYDERHKRIRGRLMAGAEIREHVMVAGVLKAAEGEGLPLRRGVLSGVAGARTLHSGNQQPQE